MSAATCRARPPPSIERLDRSMPGVRRHLLADQRRLACPRARRREEPRVEPPGRVGGVTQRDSGTSRSVRSRRSERLDDRGPRRRRRERDDGQRTRSRAVPPVRQQDADLLERLADGRDVAPSASIGPQVATERLGGGPGVTTLAPSPRVGSASSTRPPGKDVHVGRERHRRRPVGEQHLEPVGPPAAAGRRSPPVWLDSVDPDGARRAGRSDGRRRDRQAADEVAADVGRRTAVDGDAVVEQRDRESAAADAASRRQHLERSPGRPDRPEQRPPWPSARSPTTATSTTSAAANEAATSHWAKPVG